jgi:hypothetical protein
VLETSDEAVRREVAAAGNPPHPGSPTTSSPAI